MTAVWFIAAYVVYMLLSIGLACAESDVVSHRMRVGNKNQIEHFWWALIWTAMITPVWFKFHSLWIVVSIGMLHLHIFGSAYASLRGNNIFYLSPTSKAKTEIWMRKHFKSAEIPYLVSFLISVGLLIKSILNG